MSTKKQGRNPIIYKYLKEKKTKLLLNIKNGNLNSPPNLNDISPYERVSLIHKFASRVVICVEFPNLIKKKIPR